MKKALLVIAVIAVAAMTFAETPALPKTPAPGKALIYIYRPLKFAGSAGSMNLFLDGRDADRQIGSLRLNDYYCVEVDPGDHLLYANYSTVWSEHIVQVKAGDSYFVNISMVQSGMSGYFGLDEEDLGEGAKAVASRTPGKSPKKP